MKLCCPPKRSVQGSAFHNTGSFARFFVHLFCSRCWCSVLVLVGGEVGRGRVLVG